MTASGAKLTGAGLRPHEIQALEFLMLGPDKIKTIADDNTMAAALVFADLERRGYVHIDKDDGAVITISTAGRSALKGSQS